MRPMQGQEAAGRGGGNSESGQIVKYDDLRDGIKTGDLLLCSGDSLASSIILKSLRSKFFV